MKQKIVELFRKGLFHIVGSNFINKCITFVTNVALVRILTKEEFGIFTSAFNIFSIVFLFSGFGIASGMLYFCSQKRSAESKEQYYKYSFAFGLIAGIILSAIMFLYGMFAPLGIEETRKYILLLAILPLVGFVFDYFSIILRTQEENKKYSLLMNANTVIYAGLAILGSCFFGITGTIMGRYLAYIISAVMGFTFCKRFLFIQKKANIQLLKDEKKGLISYSVKAGLTSAMNNILYRIDIFLIGIFVADAAILASYKVGVTIPENLNFIPQSMMVFFLPIIIKHAKERDWLRSKVKQLYAVMALLCGAMTVVLLIAGPLIIRVFWGVQYMDAVPCFRILSISFFFLSTFRLTSTNVLLSLGKAGYTLIVSIISGLCNIVLDIWLTITMGAIGAAYATLIVTILASALSFPYVLYLIYNKREQNTQTNVDVKDS